MLCTQAYWLLVKTCARKKILALNEKSLQELFEKFLYLPSPETHELASALIAHIIQLKEEWPSFFSAIEWADPNQVRDKALLERTTCAIAKILLRENPNPDFTYRFYNFLDYLAGITEQYPDLVFTRYYFCKLLIHRQAFRECRQWIKPLLKIKKNDFWVWHLAAKCYPKSIQLSCLCKALSCGGKEQMLCNVRQDLADLLIASGNWPEAKYEIERILAIRKKENWKISEKLEVWLQLDDFRNAESKKLNYNSLIHEAENLIWEEENSVIALVTSVIEDRVYYVCQSGQKGTISYTRSKIGRINVGATLRLFFAESKSGGNRIQHVQEYKQECKWIKDFKGTLKLHNNGFGFIEDVFVPNELLHQYEYEKTMPCLGKAIFTYNQKKQKMGWKAVILI